MHRIVNNIITGDLDSFFLIAGPCAVESYETSIIIAEQLKVACDKLDIPLIFKASFKKANRTKLDSFKTIGSEESIRILESVKQELDIPITTDIHETSDIDVVKGIVDLIQIPAFLCRQTDLIVGAALTGIPVNIKKGQFMSAESMKYAAEKVIQSKNSNVFLTERGNSFGYQDLVVDFRNLSILRAFCNKVIMDCTHATQRPNASDGITGGNPIEIENMAKAAIVSGAEGLFIETHPEPSEALSDGANMLPLDQLEGLLTRLNKLTVNYKNIYG